MPSEIVFDPWDIMDESAPVPSHTTETQNGHQWYISATAPATTISVGRTHGPTGNGFYIATANDGFISTNGAMAMQSNGPTGIDSVGAFTMRVTAATKITTDATIDLHATSTVTVIAGSGETAVLAAAHPGNEGGSPNGGGAASPPAVPPGPPATPDLPSFPPNAPAGPPDPHGSSAVSGVGVPVITGVLGGLAIAEGGFSAIGGVASVGGSIFNAGMAIATARAESAAAESRSAADSALGALPPSAAAAGGGGPDIDMTAAARILGKAQTGIAWYTPAAIKSTADTAIQCQSPIIKHIADVEIVNNSGVFIKNKAGTQIKSDAPLIESSCKQWKATAMVTSSTTGLAMASMFSAGSTSITGLAAVGITAGAMCKIKGMGITSITGGILLKLESGGQMMFASPIFKRSHGVVKEKAGTTAVQVGSLKYKAMMFKAQAVNWGVKAATAKYQAASIKLG
ncbi:MAG: hypothetical protein R3A48_25995 [Polyangiales bacterium]